MNRNQIEICCGSIQSAANAKAGGAVRVELCQGLVEGGTPPSPATIEYAVKELGLQVFVLVRPRGGDFCYNKLEIKTEIVKAVAASGGMILAMLVNMRILSHINTFFAFCISGALGVMAFIATEYLLKSELIVYSLVMVKESVTKKRKKS